ncbi:MAG: hypothetical protein JWQ90_2377 [Hydrocarboniphaga sp.]|uniref:hypothetical protein n=1 Tax=Hydrocarboniphaga sp. TaxID=2033016 RepID=UPI002619D3AA|nr:hypothetical protein [Hydrocarboniphaga sp.]MDB5969927.1 hypothetical protein [Hydrocarboniphaga sp.]
MACCAIAAFLFGQIYFGVMAARRWLFGERSAAAIAVTVDAADWRAGQLSPRPAPRPWLRWFDYSPRRAALILVLSTSALGVAYAAGQAADDGGVLASVAGSRCGGLFSSASRFP